METFSQTGPVHTIDQVNELISKGMVTLWTMPDGVS